MIYNARRYIVGWKIESSISRETVSAVIITSKVKEMIKSFKDGDTEIIFHRQTAPKLPPDIHRVALRKLLMIDAASSLKDLKIPPGNRLEALKKERKGQYSIRINDQWRVCFIWKEGNAYDVEIADYH